MKKLVNMILFTSMLIGGGVIEPVEVDVPIVIEKDDSAFYLGLGYGLLNQKSDNIVGAAVTSREYEVNTAFLQAGYQYNKYIALEGRYWYGVTDASIDGVDTAGDYYSWGIYAKPMYPIDDFVLYAMAGYSFTYMKPATGNWDTDGLSAGVGAKYMITEDISIFADYIMMSSVSDFDLSGVNTKADTYISTINVGLTYSF